MYGYVTLARTETRYAAAGERLRRARLHRGFSHDRLAEAIGGTASRFHLIRLEKGLHRPKPAMLEALSRILEEDVAGFYEVEGPDEDDEEAAPLAGKSLDEILKLRIDAMVRESLQAHIPTREVEAA